MKSFLFALSALLLTTSAQAARPEAWFPLAQCETKKGVGTHTKMEIFVLVNDDGHFDHSGVILFEVGLPYKPESRIKIETKGRGDEAFGGELKIQSFVPGDTSQPYMSFTLPADNGSEQGTWVKARDAQGTTIDLFCHRS